MIMTLMTILDDVEYYNKSMIAYLQDRISEITSTVETRAEGGSHSQGGTATITVNDQVANIPMVVLACSLHIYHFNYDFTCSN